MKIYKRFINVRSCEFLIFHKQLLNNIGLIVLEYIEEGEFLSVLNLGRDFEVMKKIHESYLVIVMGLPQNMV